LPAPTIEMPEPQRDPDALLARAQREEARAGRGRLHLWFGAAPGVGKTFAMLAAAQRMHAEGADVVIGLIETHGRAETQALLRGLLVLPRRTVDYRGHALHELDLDAALARRPAVLVVDELAHTNAPGSRFPKRWQDVQALLDAGIAVFTTLNVQHVESLNDVVAQITGVEVRETVPDAAFDAADEVELVDLPPDVLLERLRGGKVYVPEAARAAESSFFRRGNLTALRELALRKTAQWVDAQLQRYKQEHGVRRIWRAGDRVLVCVGPSPSSAQLVRAAHRAAAATHAELFAVYVETPRTLRRLGRADRERVLQNLRLAQSLGARTVTLDARNAADAVVAFARDHNVGRIVLGKSARSRWQEVLFGSFTLDLIGRSGDIDVHAIRVDGERDGPAPAADAAPPSPRRSAPRHYLLALGCTALATGAAWLLYSPPDLSSEAMVMMLGIVLAALLCGIGPALVAALVSVAAFNFLFTEPRFSFAVADPTDVVALLVMLIVGFTMASLVERVHERAEATQERERETAALFSLTRELAQSETVADVGQTTVAHLRDAFAGDIAVLVPTADGALGEGSVVASSGVPDWLDERALAVARWCWDHGKAAGEGTPNLPGSPASFVPLHAPEGRAGVLALRRAPGNSAIPARQRLLLATFAEQAALALGRVRSTAERLRAQRDAERERLRSTLLSSVSHDLRTPLATITGAASSLLDDGARHGEAARRELAQSVLDEAQRLDDLIANLVFATRLDAGGVELRREWVSIEEVVGAALRRAAEPLRSHRVDLHIAPDLPLVQADAVLLEQALYNLLENAARHTAPGTRVEVGCEAKDGSLVLEVADEGPGVPAADRERVFRRFERGPKSAGMGLGLPICAGIFEAHGGRVWVATDRAVGAAFRASLPLPAEPPQRPVEAPEVA
jgi:two-component system sensor histidine kinase KdpD